MKVVIDTNVLLVADKQHGDITDTCLSNCVTKLLELQVRGHVVIDDGYRIIGEYQNKLDANHGKNMGAAFLKWLLQNQANPRHVERIRITETSANHFEEFPSPELELEFDPPDCKFIAVANAHPQKPTIWQAADSKWLNWWPMLQVYGIQVEFLCSEDVVRFYREKFPDQDIPALP